MFETASEQNLPVLNSEAIIAFSNISSKSYQLRHSKTPGEKIKERKGKDGQMWQYIQRIDAMEWLDKHYPGWSFELVPDSFKEYAGYISAVGKLTVIETGHIAFKRVITCVGVDEIEFRRDNKSIPVAMMYYKNAETDALKRCVFTLGGFSDVYTDEDRIKDEAIISDEELKWFLDNAYPILYKRFSEGEMNARKLFKSLIGYIRGDISHELILKAFPELNTDVKLKKDKS